MTFRPGDHIAWRLKMRIDATRVPQLSYVIPLVVVRDTPEEIAVFRRPGHISKRRNAVVGGPRPETRHTVLVWQEGFADEEWRDCRVLLLKDPTAESSVSVFWRDATDAVAFYYIDLTSPVTRSEVGFDVVENGLDIVVRPDLSSWRWKDVDEMEDHVARGIYSRAEFDALRREGERAVEELLRERDRLAEWSAWRPDPSWSIAELPKGWDRL